MITAYEKVLEAYTALRERRCVQSNNSGGAHYLLVYALMQAGISCRGLSNDKIEGLAITFLEKGESHRDYV